MSDEIIITIQSVGRKRTYKLNPKEELQNLYDENDLKTRFIIRESLTHEVLFDAVGKFIEEYINKLPRDLDKVFVQRYKEEGDEDGV